MALDISRRLFLRGAAVVAPALAVPAVATAASYAEENHDLLVLGPKIEAAERQLASATDYYNDALSIGRRLWPRAPDEILTFGGSKDSDLERDITGRGYDWPPETEKRYLSPIERYRQAAEHASKARGPGSKARRQAFARRLELAEEYETRKEQARRASGFPDADRQLEEVVADVERLGHAIHAAEAKTMAGVAIKAIALRAWGRVPRWRQVCVLNGREEWAPGLASSLLSVLEVS